MVPMCSTLAIHDVIIDILVLGSMLEKYRCIHVPQLSATFEAFHGSRHQPVLRYSIWALNRINTRVWPSMKREVRMSTSQKNAMVCGQVLANSLLLHRECESSGCSDLESKVSIWSQCIGIIKKWHCGIARDAFERVIVKCLKVLECDFESKV